MLAFACATVVGMLLLFRLAQRVIAPKHSLRAELTGTNPAAALYNVGNVLGVFIIAGSVVANSVEGESWKTDVTWVAAFGGMGLALFAVTSRLGAMMLLRSKLTAEIERGNAAAGIAAGGHAVATAVIVARALSGSQLRDLGLSAVFFLIAQASLHLLVLLFRALTPYDDGDEIMGENVAAALSYAGLTIAVGMIVGRAVEGEFTTWAQSLRGYAYALGYGALLYPVRQLVVQTVLLGSPLSLRKGKLDDAIAKERSVASGALEAIAYVATALVVLKVG
jgi:uncharacterized membrane protein YjfL (UPF0719 family)